MTAGQESLEQQFLLERKATEMVTLSYGFYHQAVVLREAVAGDAEEAAEPGCGDGDGAEGFR